MKEILNIAAQIESLSKNKRIAFENEKQKEEMKIFFQRNNYWPSVVFYVLLYQSSISHNKIKGYPFGCLFFICGTVKQGMRI